MIVHRCVQGSPEWHKARAGCITASMFKVARSRVGGLTDQQQAYVNAILAGESEASAAIAAGYKTKPRQTETVQRALAGLSVGDPSEAALNYAFRLAVERISGEPLDEGFETWQMRRGHELEPDARREHEAQAGVIVERAGFVSTDDGLFGGSADGLITPDGGSEYKCLVSPEGMRRVIVDGDISEFIDQVQGCMWLTGAKWWHFAMYCPALSAAGKQLWWVEVKRDDDYIESLEADLLAFNQLVNKAESALRMPLAA